MARIQPSFPNAAEFFNSLLVLLRHKVLYFARFLIEAAQQGHRRKCLTRTRTSRRRMVAIEFGMWPLGPQRWILWVCNLRECQPPGTSRWNEVLRGESSPFRRSRFRRPRCRAWRDGGSRAILVLRNARARPPASAPDNRARCASVAW